MADIKSCYFLFLALLVFSVSGCNERMTYPEFLNNFQQNCPHSYLVLDLKPQKAEAACSCMYRITVEKWPDMDTLLTSIPILDRAPRGETDFVPSAIRMATPYCMKGQDEKV